MLKQVEIEVHSYCNRKCDWCPNKYIDRISSTEYLNEDAYLRALLDLRQYEYTGVISFSRYNEPMSKMNVLEKCLKQARSILPDCKLVFNTNGDYLSIENIERLEVDELSIMDYDCIGIEQCKQKLPEVEWSEYYPYLYGKWKDTDLVYFVDWSKNNVINNRGGALPEYSNKARIKWCDEPTKAIAIDYNGNVMPCCNVRSDVSQHKLYSLGNIKTNSIIDIFNSDKAQYIKENLMIPCKMCHKYGGRYL